MTGTNYLKNFVLLSLLASFACFCELSLANDAPVFPLSIEGNWVPGGMLFGKTAPGAQLKILNRELIADSHGEFVFGLGRDVTGNVRILINSEGQAHEFTFMVESREYKVQRINGVEKKYVSPPKEVLARISADAAQVRAARETLSQELNFRESFIWPANGPVTGVYGSQRVFNGVPKRPHYGLDIAGPVGTPIYAPAGGVVTLAVNDMYYSGGTLIVDHGYGISSTFIHLSEILVKPGQRLKQGELIAKMGATGRATGSHLDWRINWFEQRLDPALVLPERPTAHD